MIYEIKNTEIAVPLFCNMNDTTITSCLQGIMGKVYADDPINPQSAMALLGDFCFLAGCPSEELALYKPADLEKKGIIIIPENDKWAETIKKCYGDRVEEATRYALKKDGDIFDRDYLKEIVNGLSDEYTLTLVNEELFDKCMNTDWCKDFVCNFPDYSLYKDYGLGVVLLKDGEVVAGASAYSGYREGIEIEIITKEEYRRKGLAAVCGASLILNCLERNLYPSWDAANKMSVNLAMKLGYHFDKEYKAYEIGDY